MEQEIFRIYGKRCLYIPVSQYSVSMMYTRLCRRFSRTPKRKHEKYKNTERVRMVSWQFLRTRHRNLTIERRKELNLSVELVRSHWKATHVTGELSTCGETIVRVLQSCTEAMRVRNEGQKERKVDETVKERDREELSRCPGGQRAHVLIKFSGNLGDSKQIRLKAFHRRTVTDKGQ